MPCSPILLTNVAMDPIRGLTVWCPHLDYTYASTCIIRMQVHVLYTCMTQKKFKKSKPPVTYTHPFKKMLVGGGCECVCFAGAGDWLHVCEGYFVFVSTGMCLGGWGLGCTLLYCQVSSIVLPPALLSLFVYLVCPTDKVSGVHFKLGLIP
jgi:hypothetical protein